MLKLRKQQRHRPTETKPEKKKKKNLVYKSRLKELCHQHGWELPVYTTVKDGPDHCPRFTTAVSVTGTLFQSPLNQCKSSKESQNVAAKLAYDHFSASPASVASPPPPPPPAFLGFAASSGIVDVRHSKNDNLHHNLGGNVVVSPVNETPLVHKDESRAKDLLHVYKSRLQHYAQKKTLALPEYSYEFDGPPHARLFRATVTIDGRTYRSLEYYPTLKDAEHAAAKVALESLSLGEIQEDEGLYKSLLQELAQKERFYFPSYRTVKTGPSHMPTFVSIVEVGGETYQGRECKTKKQSEMSAAKVAYNSLMERTAVNNLPPGCGTKENLEVPSLRLEPVINDKCQPNIGAETTEEYHVGVTVGETAMDSRSLQSRRPPLLSHPSREALQAESSSIRRERSQIRRESPLIDIDPWTLPVEPTVETLEKGSQNTEEEGKPQRSYLRHTAVRNFEKLDEIYGRDRATGKHAVSPKQRRSQWEAQGDDACDVEKELNNEISSSSKAAPSSSSKPSQEKKRMRTIDLVSEEIKSIKEGINAVAAALDRGNLHNFAEEQLYKEIENVGGMSETSQMLVYQALTRDVAAARAFLACSPERRRLWLVVKYGESFFDA